MLCFSQSASQLILQPFSQTSCTHWLRAIGLGQFSSPPPRLSLLQWNSQADIMQLPHVTSSQGVRIFSIRRVCRPKKKVYVIACVRFRGRQRLSAAANDCSAVPIQVKNRKIIQILFGKGACSVRTRTLKIKSLRKY